MRAPPGPRGFTLVELLVGTAVGTIVLTGVCLVFVSQASQYQAHASRRAVQASVRQALGVMERHVRNAGYGVDPDRAILRIPSAAFVWREFRARPFRAQLEGFLE